MSNLADLILAECVRFDQSNWRKTPEQMVAEVELGDSKVEFGPFRRVVSVGYCVIERSDGRLLKEIKNTRKSDNRVWERNQDVGGKLRLEDPSQAAMETLREISEELNIPMESLIGELESGRFTFTRVEETGSEDGTGSAYPGVPAIWTNYWFRWQMPEHLVQETYTEEDDHKVCLFGWVDPA